MSRFINPYNFIPVAKAPGPSPLPIKDFERGKVNHVRHDRWLGGSDTNGPTHCSGRIICELEAETEFFVGSEQTPGRGNQPTRVEPYRLNGQLAIPGSTLRGMIGSVLEAATNSALRVLEDTAYSRRASREDPTRVPLHSARAHFESVSEKLLPLRQDDRRHELSLAEQLLGFVEEPSELGPADELGPCLALASRIRVSAARAGVGTTPTLLGPVTLKILASPKPPCPPFYFSPSEPGGAGLSKAQLEKHRPPRGRKVYLHQEVALEAASDSGRGPWATLLGREDLDQKLSIRPIRRGAVFVFDVEFDNLSRFELDLLCFALRPSPAFRHKLGLGKPLGLGTVRVDPAAVLLIDRAQRYRSWSGYTAPRYSQFCTSSGARPDSWPPCYAADRAALVGPPSLPPPHDLADRARQGLETGGEDMIRAVQALLRLGDPLQTRGAPVHYPQLAGHAGGLLESEHFRWFAQNEKSGVRRRALPNAWSSDLSLPRNP